MRMPILWYLAYGLLVSSGSWAETYHVGPSRDTQNLQAIASRLQPGDVVEIDPGVYREVMTWRAKGTPEKPIVIRGVGNPRPVFDADQLNVSGRGSIPRAIFQIEGAYLLIEHLEFRNARNGNNGAGIRLNDSTYATIRDCKISFCDMGIQGGDRETVVIEDCEVCSNGCAEFNGYSHNFYMAGNRVVVRRSYIHDSLYGQNYKSRAHYNELWYNWIMNSNEGEVGPVDGKGQTDRPHSNVLLVGNVIISKPDRTGNRSKYILMGSESGDSHDGTLYMFYNVLIAGSPRVQCIILDDPKSNAEVYGNIFWGSSHILDNVKNSKVVLGRYNWMPKEANVPSGFTQSFTSSQPGFVNQKENDFRLTPDSPLIQPPMDTLIYIDGDGITRRVPTDPMLLQKVRSIKFE